MATPKPRSAPFQAQLLKLEPSRLDEARRALDLIAQQWDRTLARLKMAVER